MKKRTFKVWVWRDTGRLLQSNGQAPMHRTLFGTGGRLQMMRATLTLSPTRKKAKKT